MSNNGKGIHCILLHCRKIEIKEINSNDSNQLCTMTGANVLSFSFDSNNDNKHIELTI